MKLVFIDTETTGLDSDKFARLCQVAYKIDDVMVNELFKPPVAIGIGAMAVHHITEDMVKDKPAFVESEYHSTLKDMFKKKANVFIAHNAKFDIEMIKREGIDVKSQICTKIVAQRLLPKGPGGPNDHKLQTLRYHFGIDLSDAKAHDAAGDVEVLEAVFYKLLEVAREQADKKAEEKGLKKFTDKQIIDRMIELSMSPMDSSAPMPFGKYAGIKLKDLVETDRRYCEWLVREKDDDRDGLVTTLRHLLNKPKNG